MSALDHRMSSAELDSFGKRLGELEDYHRGKGEAGVAEGFFLAARALHEARSQSFQTRAQRRMPKTVFGKPYTPAQA